MRLLRTERDGTPGCAALDERGSLRDVSAIWPPAAPVPNAAILSALRAADLTALPVVADARIDACAGAGGKIICVGLNYSDHAAELGVDLPAEPMLFLKPGSTAAGPDDPLVIPRGFDAVDWEAELGIVIGETARDVPQDAARRYVAGYCVVNDVTDRRWGDRDPGQWMKGKSADGFTSIGPWLVTPDAVADPHDLKVTTILNGERCQSGHTGAMKFGVDALVSYVSRFTTLRPGDVISSGTPAGVGKSRKPPRFLAPGDRIEVEIDGLGRQVRLVA